MSGDVDERDVNVVTCQFEQHGTDPTCCEDPGPNPWGWKTREYMFMDAAVRILEPTAPVLGSPYVFGDPITPAEPWDMAFVITTEPIPLLPIAAASANPNPAACNQQISFDGSGSYHEDPVRTIVLYEWDFDYDGVTFNVDSAGQTVPHAYAQFGTYTAALRVTDDDSPPVTDIDTVVVDINQGNQAPIADANGPYDTLVGGDVTLDGTGSSDPDADCGDSVVGYDWDLDNDGLYDDATGATPLVTWADIIALGLPYPGVPNPIRLRVTDTFGLSSTDGSTLTILLPAPPPPLPDDAFDIGGTVRPCRDNQMRCTLDDAPCTSDGDCPGDSNVCRTDCTLGIHDTSETYCVPPPGGGGPGVCYVRRNRYLSIDPNPANAGSSTARRVSLDLGGGATAVLGWVGEPTQLAVSGPEVSPQLLARIENVPYYRDWSIDDFGGAWPDSTVHVGDCETSPRHTYLIQAIAAGADTGDEANYSEPLALSTVQDVSGVGGFGDVVGGATGLPPEGIRSFKDISAVVRGFQGIQTEPKSWLDLQGPATSPLCPNFGGAGVDFKDIDWAVKGFQGWTYLIGPPPDSLPTGFFAPLDCPPDACPTGARLRDYSRGVCKPGPDPGPFARGTFCAEDVIVLTPSPGELHMMHRNAEYNCCPVDIIVTLTVDGNTIHLREEEVLEDPCFCMCCYDIEATVDNLAPGPYTVEVCWMDGGETCDEQVVVIP